MNSALQVALTSGLSGMVGAIVVAAIAYRPAKRSADAEVRGATSVDWSRYADGLKGRLETVEHRLDNAEARTRKADQRADRAEHLQVVTVSYLRQILDWVQQRFPEATPPQAPPELDGML
ncbi:hypothetical protein ABW16_01645 [Mycolicibacter heraklionensis]|uniref:Uncharacterized protein n=1 Tax=Mycolicibacter heraklionensis TaxID=512402 RepID=A0ABR5FKR0_9MYCO|nr:hypothetical protein [Mycolicibacter heraklionensis]KLO31570.1 hypothetical protein ABW16_01645 [Mycolicibacter heraklionensis]